MTVERVGSQGDRKGLPLHFWPCDDDAGRRAGDPYEQAGEMLQEPVCSWLRWTCTRQVQGAHDFYLILSLSETIV